MATNTSPPHTPSHRTAADAFQSHRRARPDGVGQSKEDMKRAIEEMRRELEELKKQQIMGRLEQERRSANNAEMRCELEGLKTQQILNTGNIGDVKKAIKGRSKTMGSKVPNGLKTFKKYTNMRIRKDGTFMKIIKRESETMNHGFSFLTADLQIQASSFFVTTVLANVEFELLEGAHNFVGIVGGDESGRIWPIKFCVKHDKKHDGELCFYAEDGNIARPAQFVKGWDQKEVLTMWIFHMNEDESIARELEDDLKGEKLLSQLKADGGDLTNDFGAWEQGMRSEYKMMVELKGFKDHPHFADKPWEHKWENGAEGIVA